MNFLFSDSDLQGKFFHEASQFLKVTLPHFSLRQGRLCSTVVRTSWRVSEGVSVFFLGEAIPIYAEIENCSSRLIVPKAAIFQTQTYLASGKTKTVRLMVANVRGNHIASGSTDTWNGKTLKIPPVTPSILDCCIIRVHYSLAVSAEPGGRETRAWSQARCCAPERCPFMSVSQQIMK